ncbi:aldo/keto reductase [Amycolatopsis pigmentata]|uniref:Aldo/keto reductase n=1 Tax=Amycolatopsis pigmentata TaxID=450801 RepID=A0ABW5FYV1_9PSEU
MHDTPTTTGASDTVKLGDKTVSRMAFGAMRLADPAIWGPPADRDHSIRLARRAVELGVDHIDTADSYGLGVVEDILREALHPYPDHVLIATKVGQVQPRPGEWVPIGHPALLRHQTEMSLRRLGVDRIDLLYLHRADPNVPFADQVGTMKELRDEGKIAHFGLSEAGPEQIELARGIIDVAAVQNIYNLTTRHWDHVVEYCTRENIPFVPWFPVMNGALAQPGGVAAEVATATGSTPTQVALAWLLARAEVICPIPGTSSIAHLEENVAAASLRLTDEQIASLTAAVAPAAE